ncbi:hypothetical protein OHT57_22145 [Streptomyces sp. NBC_00285]|uniref:hypothetical protein n=1 Tax=Streptomyces sp. NBC_00285 TaxID=2975700 RepID=UPI002E2E71AE|nr:hypothetical protein [Streptomyces sp. NBC_00285]
MHSRGRVLKFTAVSVLVVLSLTGFSTGHGHSSGRHKSKSSHGDSGGGCSSSRQNHDSYTPRTRSTGSTSTHSSSTLRDGTAVLVSCATQAIPYATVEVSNPNSRQATFTVDVAFDDAAGTALRSTEQKVTVPARGTSSVRVQAGRAVAAKLDHCRVAPEADVVS